MNALTISFVLVRLAAIFLFVQAIQGLATFSYLLASDAEFASYGAVTVLFTVVLPGAIALVLWLHPEKVTGAQQTGNKSEAAFTAEQVLMIGVSLIGLYVAIYGVVDVVQTEVAHFLKQQGAARAGFADEHVDAGLVAKRVAAAVQLAIATALLLGRRGLARLLVRARYAGVERKVSHDSEQGEA